MNQPGACGARKSAYGGSTDDQDYWYFGWLLQKKVTDKLVIGGELFYQTATTIGGKDSAGFNIGAVYDFDEHNHLLVSMGHGLQCARHQRVFLVRRVSDYVLGGAKSDIRLNRGAMEKVKSVTI